MPWSTILFLAAIVGGVFLLKRGQINRMSNSAYVAIVVVWLAVGLWTTFGLFAALSVGIPALALLLAVFAVAVWWAMGFALIKKRREGSQQALAARRRA